MENSQQEMRASCNLNVIHESIITIICMQTIYITNIESLLQKIFWNTLRLYNLNIFFFPFGNRAITDNIHNFLWKWDPYYVPGLEKALEEYSWNEWECNTSKSKSNNLKRTLVIANGSSLSTPRRIQQCTRKGFIDFTEAIRNGLL